MSQTLAKAMQQLQRRIESQSALEPLRIQRPDGAPMEAEHPDTTTIGEIIERAAEEKRLRARFN